MKKHLKILFVDDDKNVVESFGTAFKLLGHNVDGILDPLLALEKFKKDPHTYDLIVSDFTMAKMLGLDFISEIKSVNPDVCIVLCTGNEDDLIKEKAKLLGVQKILYKPFDFEELQAFFDVLINENDWK